MDGSHPPAAFRLDSLSPTHLALFLEGKRLFNAGAFWEAHEAWEDIWREKEGPQKRILQGLIQAAAAYHLIVTRPRIKGAVRNIEKSLGKLHDMPDECFGVRVDRLRATLKAARTEALKCGQDGLASMGEGLVARL